MAYVVYLSEQAKTELATIKRSGDKKTIKKIAKLVDWIAGTPAHWNGTSGALEAFCLRGNVVKTHQQAISYDLRNSWSWDLCLRCLIAFSLWWQVNSFFNSILPILNTRSHFEPNDERLASLSIQRPRALWRSVWSKTKSYFTYTFFVCPSE